MRGGRKDYHQLKPHVQLTDHQLGTLIVVLKLDELFVQTVFTSCLAEHGLWKTVPTLSKDDCHRFISHMR